MAKGDLLYLGHMLDTARQILAKVSDISRREFDQDENLRFTVAHLLQMLGESARRVSPESQQSYPEIPWSLIIGMRHKIVHDYMEVDFDIIWEAATGDLFELVGQLERIVPPEDPLS